MEAGGWSVLEEPGIETQEGLRKPDLVVWRENGRAYILYVQVIDDSNVGPLEDFAGMKVQKYDKPDIVEKSAT